MSKSAGNGASKADGSASKGFNFPTLTFHLSLIVVVVSLAVFRLFVTDSDDPAHCHALMNRGRWLDDTHTSWQPEGCMLVPYKPTQITSCLANRKVVFMGDSTVRQVFYAMVHMLDPTVDTTGEKHSDRVVQLKGETEWEFHWDPFLNSTRLDDLLRGEVLGATGHVPSLAVLGSGIWYLRHADSGGYDSWSSRVDALFAASSSPIVIADQIALMPVEEAVESRLSPERAATVHRDDILAMNSYLDDRMKAFPTPMRPTLAVARVFNEIIEGLDEETPDGLHFTEQISKVQANVLLNLRCNDLLDKKFPFDKTCCSAYPRPNWVQTVGLVFLLTYAPLGMWLYSQGKTRQTALAFFPEEKYLAPLSIFGLSITFLFLADRTSLFLKENKQYTALSFLVLSLLSLAAGAVTMKPGEKDLGFLNREQTDEWKGWMQVAILIYHYLGASKISGIYNPIRVLVAAYLFMSGYGHLSFFVKKADFGFARVANILVRLNLLTVVLAYVMDTDYLSYYFSPLVTMWFLIIWVTLYLGHAYNQNTLFLVGKLTAAAALVAAYFLIPGPLEKTFDLTNMLFATAWNAKEWRFRVALDMWIVWLGMGVALAFIKIQEAKLTDRPEWDQWQRWTIWGSAGTMVAYFVFELTRESKFVYNGWHPYVAFWPVIAFAVLRNATPWLRSTSSRFFVFFGQCSLETFIIQFHLFIAGDTKGIIMMVPGGAFLRPLNFTITSLIFVFISHHVAQATGSLTALLCKPGPARDSLPLAGRSAPAASHQGRSSSVGGGGQYVPLQQVERRSPTSSSGAEDLVAAAGDGLEIIKEEPGPLQKAWEWVRRDLRVRMLVMWGLLVALNWVYPSEGTWSHLLPTH